MGGYVGARDECRWCKSDKLYDQGTMSGPPLAATDSEFGLGDFGGGSRTAYDPGTCGLNVTLGLGRVPH